MKKNLQLLEIQDIEEIIEQAPKDFVRAQVLCSIEKNQDELPLWGICVGTEAKSAPTVVIVGGVHGLERIGSHVVIAYLKSITERLKWSISLQNQLKQIRIIFVPVVNPMGMHLGARSNGNGVDLMRNAPIESKEAPLFFGGQNWTSRLPYFRGFGYLEKELIKLEEYIIENTFKSKAVLLLDVHSGFGVTDRIWFPYARESNPFPHWLEIYKWVENFEEAFPNHPYIFEPQSVSYCTHGDFWDYLYDRFYGDSLRKKNVFIPITLEMGSWLWLKKNPKQFFSFLGAFNPIKPHRKRRVLRRHVAFLDYLKDAVESHSAWTQVDEKKRMVLKDQAQRRWYPDKKLLFRS